MPGPIPLATVVEYLDDYLRIAEVPDEPNAVNGLQVESSGYVGGIVAAVDASLTTIEGVVARAAAFATPPLLLVHHGLFWDGNRPVRGPRYRRLRALLKADVAVYAAHIPLDVHPEIGNNIVLARQIGLRDLVPFDSYKGIAMGYRGRAPDGTSRENLVADLDRLLRTQSRLIPGGPQLVTQVGVITGGAGSRIGAAHAAGLDAFITGEGAHYTYFDAIELGVNVVFAGHYATEQVGVKALAEQLSGRFDLPWEFHDHPTGL